MTDRPIIFSAPMVRALLDGRKTQTRRILNDVPVSPHPHNIVHKPKHPAPYLDSYCSKPKTALNPRGMSENWCWWTRDDRCGEQFKVRYVPGDRLWVKETHFQWGMWAYHPDAEKKWSFHADYGAAGGSFMYEGNQADGYQPPKRTPGRLAWYRRPSIYMPREASRLTLHVTGVKVERLQDISEADAIAEGVEEADEARGLIFADHRTAFADLWKRLHGPDAWAANPWVVAITFRVVRANIDSPEAKTT